LFALAPEVVESKQTMGVPY